MIQRTFVLMLIFGLGIAVPGCPNARSTGMAGAYTALARGVEAPFWNPANLGLSDNRRFSINLLSIGLGLSNNSFSRSLYDIYNGAFLTDADKKDILENIPSGGVRIDISSHIRVIGLSFGSFAFTTSGEVASDLTFSKGYFERLLYGLQPEQTYRFDGTGGKAWAFSTIALSGARRIPVPFFKKFAMGMSFKYLLGLGYGEVVRASGTITTSLEGYRGDGEVLARHALGGRGFAVDWGIAATLEGGWIFSLSMMNVMGQITWDKEVREFWASSSFFMHPILSEDADGDSLMETSDSDTTMTLSSIKTRMPPRLRLGVAKFWKRMILAFDYDQAFVNAPGVVTKAKFSWGLEYKGLKFLPLRTGMSFGGREGKASAVGLGLHLGPLGFDFGVSFPGSLLPKVSKGLTFALSLGINTGGS